MHDYFIAVNEIRTERDDTRVKEKNEQIKQIWIIKFWRRRYFVEQLDEGHVSAFVKPYRDNLEI